MTREEAITVLKGLLDNPLFSNQHKAAFNIAIHDIKAHHDWDINNLILINKDNYEPLEQEPRWIPVSERLPRKEGDYLVTVRNKEYGFQYIDITPYEHSEWGYKDEWQVIAWINVPSEYKEEREGK